MSGCGGMADAQDSKSCGGDLVWVQVPPSALNERQKNPEMAAFPGFFYMEVQDVKRKSSCDHGRSLNVGKWSEYRIVYKYTIKNKLYLPFR